MTIYLKVFQLYMKDIEIYQDNQMNLNLIEQKLLTRFLLERLQIQGYLNQKVIIRVNKVKSRVSFITTNNPNYLNEIDEKNIRQEFENDKKIQKTLDNFKKDITETNKKENKEINRKIKKSVTS